MQKKKCDFSFASFSITYVIENVGTSLYQMETLNKSEFPWVFMRLKLEMMMNSIMIALLLLAAMGFLAACEPRADEKQTTDTQTEQIDLYSREALEKIGKDVSNTMQKSVDRVDHAVDALRK
jgi:hypothetical protein